MRARHLCMSCLKGIAKRPSKGLLIGVLAFGIGLTPVRADDCGPPMPVSVTAVCGQTLLLTGWRRPYLSEAFAEEIPTVSLQLLDSGGSVIAAVMSDARGYFAFPRVSAGQCTLHADDQLWYFNWPVIVTKSNQPCRQRLYVYPTIGGWPCRTHATLDKPAEITRSKP